MSQDRITTLWDIPEIVANGKQALQVVQDTNKQIAANAEKMQTIKLYDTSSLADLKKFQQAAKELTKEQADSYIKLTKGLENLSKSRLNEAKAAESQAKEYSLLIKAKETLDKRQKKEGDNLRKNNSEYQKLQKQYRETANRAKDLGVTLGVNSKEFLEVSQSAMQMHNKLMLVDKAVGQNHRNIGNYSSATNNLSFSVTQLVRELPAAAYGLNVFIGAISNNIGGVQDALKGIKRDNEILLQQGKQQTSVWKTVAGTIFSWQTALTVGITLLTTYGQDIVNFFTNVGEEAKEAKDAIEAYKDALQGAFDAGRANISEAKRTSDILLSIAQDTALSEEQRLRAARELKRLYPEQLKNYKEEAILAGEAAKGIREIEAAITANAKARGASNLAEENRKLLEDGNDALLKRQAEAQRKVQEAQQKLNNLSASTGGVNKNPNFVAITEAAEALKVAKQEYSKITIEVERATAAQQRYNQAAEQFAKEAGQLYLPDDGETERRLKEEQKAYEKSQKEAEKLLKDWRAMRTAEDEAQFKTQVMQFEQEADAYKALAEDKNQTDAARFEALKDYYRMRAMLIQEAYEREKATGEKTNIQVEQLEAQKQSKIKDLAIETDKIDNSIVNDRVERRREANDAALKDLKQWKEAVADIGTYLALKEEREHAERIRMMQEYAQRLASISQFLTQLTQANTDKRIRALNKEQEEDDRLTDRKVARIERSQKTEKEKEEAIALLEEQADVRRADRQREAAERERKQANFEKSLALAKIILNMYIGIAKEVGTKGIAGLFTAGAITAFLGGVGSAAAAIAIPSYAEGTDDHKGGLALVGEGKKGGKYQPEIVAPRGGKAFIVDSPTLLDLPKHSEVIPMHNLTPSLIDMYNPMHLQKPVVNMYSNIDTTAHDLLKDISKAVRQQGRGNITVLSKGVSNKPASKSKSNFFTNNQA